uniref:F-box domain-containing protein n=1 Tax=Ditylenchus dipsaci TaxID=166011 RepID=A0A915DSC3_9BILA
MNADILLDILSFLNRRSLNRLLTLNSTVNCLINTYFSCSPCLQVLNLQFYSPEKVHMQMRPTTYRLHEALLEETLPFILPKYIQCECTYITFNQQNDHLLQASHLFSHIWRNCNLYIDVQEGTNMPLFGSCEAIYKCGKLVIYDVHSLNTENILKYLHSEQREKSLSLKYPHDYDQLHVLVVKIVEMFNKTEITSSSFELNFKCALENFEIVNDKKKNV